MAISYTRFKSIFGDLGITEWVKYNWLSNAGTARSISNKVIEAGYNPEAYVNNNLYNHITTTINLWSFNKFTITTENVRYTINNDNSITITNSTDVGGRILIRNIEAGSYTLTFKASNTNGTFAIYSISLTQLYVSGLNTISISNFSDGPWSFLVNANSTITISEVMLVKGDSALPFIPYFEGEKFLVLVGEKDLGSFIWSKQNNKFYIQSQISDMKAVSGWKTIPNFLCSKYQVVGQVNIVDSISDKSITMIFNSQKCIQIYDSELYSSMTSVQFKQAMSGVPLDYQLATPVLVNL